MTQLELQQRGLLDLVKCRGTPPDDPYLQHVAASRELAMVREIALWWRTFQIEAQCRFTAKLLKRMRRFDAVVAKYFNSNETSPFVEELSADFLGWLRYDKDALLQAVSQFEFALLQVRAGSARAFEISWDRHPDLVFLALENTTDLPRRELGIRYHLRLDRDLKGMMDCTREIVSP